MLEVKNLVKTYKSKSGVVVKALDNVSLKFPKTGMIFVLGKSGSGKSTLLNVLGGLDSFDSGEIIVKGQSTKQFKQSHFDSFRNTYVGFIFQEYNILDNLTVGQNIALAMQLQSRKPTSENINEILDQVDLSGLGDRKPNELSGGQKQRVAIARALVKKPEIIMADEPTGALDSNTGIQIFETLKKLSKEKLVIIISHDREFSERYADRIIELKDGHVISDVSLSQKVSEEKNEDNLMFSGNEVIVKSTYELTTKDLKIINEYIKKHKKDISIKSEEKTKDFSTNSHFIETKQDEIETETGGFSLIKSHLPMKRAFQMGASGLKHKKFKLVMTILLSLVAFTMLGITSTIALTDQNTAMTNAISSSNYTQASVEKYEYHVSYFAGSRQASRSSNPLELKDNDVTGIKNILGNNVVVQHSFGLVYNDSTHINYLDYKVSCMPDSSSQGAFLSKIKRFAENNRKEIQDAGYSFITNENTKYEGFNNSVYISKYLFDSLCNSRIELEKYSESGTGEKIRFEKGMDANKAVGCKTSLENSGSVNVFEVVIGGVFDTGFNIFDSKYEPYISKEYIQTYNVEPVVYEILNAKDKDLESCFVGCKQGFVKLAFNSLQKDSSSSGGDFITTISNKRGFSNYADTKTLISKLSKEFDSTSKGFNKYCLNNIMLTQLENALASLAPLRTIFLYIGLAFIIFSGLLLANFIANSISYQKREIGILRAIGARGKDVFKIFISEAFIIALINFIASTITTWAVVTFAISPQMTKITAGVPIMRFGIIEILILFLVCFVSAFLATFIPVKRTADKKPVDAIRNK